MRSRKGRQALCQRCNRIWNISVCSDPRGVCVSELHKEGAILKEIHIRIERQNTLYNMMEKMMCVLGSVSSLGMMYVLARLVIGA